MKRKDFYAENLEERLVYDFPDKLLFNKRLRDPKLPNGVTVYAHKTRFLN